LAFRNPRLKGFNISSDKRGAYGGRAFSSAAANRRSRAPPRPNPSCIQDFAPRVRFVESIRYAVQKSGAKVARFQPNSEAHHCGLQCLLDVRDGLPRAAGSLSPRCFSSKPHAGREYVGAPRSLNAFSGRGDDGAKSSYFRVGFHSISAGQDRFPDCPLSVDTVDCSVCGGQESTFVHTSRDHEVAATTRGRARMSPLPLLPGTPVSSAFAGAGGRPLPQGGLDRADHASR
jgi:hypothetical protein